MALNFKPLILIFIFFYFFYGCSSKPNNNLSKIYDLYKNQNNKRKLLEVNSSMIENINFPVIEVRTNKIVKQVLMVRISERENIANYISGSGQGITLNGAYVTKTIGFNVNLISLDQKHNFLPKNTIKTYKVKDNQKIYKFVNPMFGADIYNVNCSIKEIEKENVKILEEFLSLLKIQEDCTSEKWKFINYYWENNDGKILKSIQNISPKGDIIELYVLK